MQLIVVLFSRNIVECSLDFNSLHCEILGMPANFNILLCDSKELRGRLELEGTRPRGRPKKTWREIVEKDCRARGLNMEGAMDRSKWKKQIGMIDDQDECEWVNVFSGTGSPGLSWTNSTEP